MSALTLDDFGTYFKEVHGHPPFTWQRDLMHEVAVARRWPDTIDLPTGAGKTACIDIAVFALALDAGSSERWSPRRIAMVVDRRVVVDQAARRGISIVRKLESASAGSAAARVRDRLASLTDESKPLRVAVMRGGMPRDDGWARTPDQPTILASTVDQIGSRLLFRGYGVKPGMWPLHAGLLGNDTLILLDEVHLSRPFQQTLDGIRRYRRASETNRFHVVALSATPGVTAARPWGLTDERRKDTLIRQRLGATKIASRVECDGRDELVDRVAQEARKMAIRHATVAVVVNRVDTAHAVVRALLAGANSPAEPRVELLTGRMRPLDRDDRVASIEPLITAIDGRRKRAAATDGLIVVATQCIEAGADFDFDALITEHASFDALRQRFGRVDRLGEYAASGRQSEAVIVAVREPNEKGKVEIPKDDPIYGTSLQSCWKLLSKLSTKKQPSIDFGVGPMDSALAAAHLDASDAHSPKPSAPALLPVYLDLWSQTSPRPFVEPEVELFLHGPRSGPPDVQVVWRVDLDDVGMWTGGGEVPAIEHVEALPPSSLESVAVPFALAKRWLRGDRSAGRGVLADVDGVSGDDRDRWEARRGSREPVGVVWRGDDSIVLMGDADDLRPGDTVVVPASRGGLFFGSFDPTAKEPVPDLGERATLIAKGRAMLRLHPGALAACGIGVPDQGGLDLLDAGASSWRRRLVNGLVTPRPITLSDGMVVLRGRRVPHTPDLPAGSPDAEQLEPATEQTTDDEASAFAGRQVKLSVHSHDVENWARRFGDRVLDDAALRGALAIAGWLHDVGKADPRFQKLLRDGSDITMARDQALDPKDWPLAKSGMDPRDRRRARFAARRSGYPRGTRHEVMSLAMIDAGGVVAAVAAERNIHGVDVELVLHLVASHHGWCRPMAPAVSECEPSLSVSLDHGGHVLSGTAGHQLHRGDSAITPRFFRLLERYGWHRLAWLEAILRLADHRASEEEADGDA